MQGSQLQDILASNIKRIRKDLGYTQAELAEMAGISTGFMSDIERCRRWPSADKFACIAMAMKLDPFQLLLPSPDSPYFDRHRTLTSFQRQALKSFEKSMAESFNNLMQPYGPIRKTQDEEDDDF
jgi:transcriptional regulator with XRE-family HTH domain